MTLVVNINEVLDGGVGLEVGRVDWLCLNAPVERLKCELLDRQAEDPKFWTAYTTTRPMGERSIAPLVADGCRKVRHRRLECNRHWLGQRAR